MARRNPRRDAAEAEARARHRAAGQKLSRLRRKGINVTNLDPRTSADNIGSMTTRQLNSYVNRLNRFTERSNSYVAGERGTPLSGQEWRQYKRAERAYNKKGQDFLDRVGDIHIAGSGGGFEARSISQYLADVSPPDAKRAAGAHRLFENINRVSSHIDNPSALRDLLRDMQRRLDPAYMSKQAQRQRKTIKKMLTEAGDADVWKKVSRLGDEALTMLVDFSDFMKRAEDRYVFVAATNVRELPSWQAQAFETSGERLHDLADWALKLGGGLTTADNDNTRQSRRPRTDKRSISRRQQREIES